MDAVLLKKESFVCIPFMLLKNAVMTHERAATTPETLCIHFLSLSIYGTL